jgi:hypothetical protein
MLLAYLSDHVSTLDEAFGVRQVARRGRKRDKEADALARRIFELRLKKRSWADIVDEIGGDERQLRRLYASRKIELLAEETDRRLRLKDPPKKGGR